MDVRGGGGGGGGGGGSSSRGPTTSVVHITVRNVLAMLRRCCNHPYLIEYPLRQADGHLRVDEELVTSCGKLALLDRMLARLHAGGHKVRACRLHAGGHKVSACRQTQGEWMPGCMQADTR